MSFSVGAAWVLVLVSFAGDVPEFDFAPTAAAPAGPPATPTEMDAARAWLVNHPASPEAARVTFDVLMAAAVAGDKATADDMRKRLIFDHAGSIQQRFLMTTIDVNAFRTLLIAEGKSQPFTQSFSQKYCRAVAMGYQAWGASLLSDDNFLLQCGIAAQIAKDNGLLEYCRKQLTEQRAGEKDGRRKTRGAAEIVFNEALAPAKKSLALHAIEGSDSAVWLAEHFDSRVPDGDRDRPDLVEARVERLLERDGFVDALPVIESLLEKDGETAKRLFWRAWCEAVLGETAALEHTRELIKTFPDDPWTAPARQAEQAMSVFDASLQEQKDAFATAVRQVFHEKIELVEATGEWKRASGALGLYLSADLSARSGEAIVRSGEKWLAAIRYETDRTQLLLDGEPEINRFHGGMPFNLPTPTVHFDPAKRRFDFAAKMHTSPGLAELDPQTTATLALLRNMQPALVQPMLEEAIEKGWLPVASQQNDSDTRYGWITFSPRKPQVETCAIHVTKDHRLAAFDCPLFALRELKFGAAGAFELKPPAWPDLPVVEHEAFEASVMFRVMAAMSRVFLDDDSSNMKAAQAADAARQ
jgi:hypothetical protein